MLDAGNNPDYNDASITENIRIAYNRENIKNIVAANCGASPEKIFFLSCDLYGVMPPITKLSHEQAAYYFLSGYTAKVGGTEAGAKTVSSTFSLCFGEPFFPGFPEEYVTLFLKRLKESNI